MSKMGIGAMAALTAAMAVAPAYAQSANTPPAEGKPAAWRGYSMTRQYNALENTVAMNGSNNVLERFYTGFTLNKGETPIVSWSALNQSTLGGARKIHRGGLAYNALLGPRAVGERSGKEGSDWNGIRPLVVFASNYDDTSARAGIRDDWLRKKLGFDYGYIDVATGTKDGNLTTFLAKNVGPTSIELFNNTTKRYGRGGSATPYSELQGNVSFDKLSKVQWDGSLRIPAKLLRGIGKGGKRLCPSRMCSDVEGMYRRQMIRWNEYPANVAGVRYTFR